VDKKRIISLFRTHKIGGQELYYFEPKQGEAMGMQPQEIQWLRNRYRDLVAHSDFNDIKDRRWHTIVQRHE